jgi:hypothetical protein
MERVEEVCPLVQAQYIAIPLMLMPFAPKREVHEYSRRTKKTWDASPIQNKRYPAK